MPERQVHVGLAKPREVGPLWEDLPQLDVVLLDLPLLPGHPGVAVVEGGEFFPGHRVDLDGEGVGELRPVVRQDDPERPRVQLASEGGHYPPEHLGDLGERLAGHPEREHEVALPEQEREEAGARPGRAGDGVHLDDLPSGLRGHRGDEVVVGAPGQKRPVARLPGLPRSPLRVLHLLLEVDVPDRLERLLVDVGVEGGDAHRDLRGVGLVDPEEGLVAILEQGGYQPLDLVELPLREADPGPGRRAVFRGPLPGRDGLEPGLGEAAPRRVGAAVAAVRPPREPPAVGELPEVRADGVVKVTIVL